MNITVVGTGYVGLANAILLSQNNEVVALDVNKEKVEKINNKQSPIADKEIEDFLSNKTLKLIATTDKKVAYWVWIPRYAYKIRYFKDETMAKETKEKTKYGYIDVVFMYGTSNDLCLNLKGDKP